MLELRKIKKTYTVGDIETQALKGVSVSFRQKEFVAILGTSGSGKTTTLNIIGGLDNYTSGDLVLNGKSTKNFKEKDWNSYRNNSIGFIFQSYNLINHLSIVQNVELGMTLSGVSSRQKHENALEALEKVGLSAHLHKKPNQLSGGQMQRVAIARALANDPDIILADEPTGALDTETSIDIMNLIKEVSKNKLVIMVTHNPELAEGYADRIVEFKDGNIISDNKPFYGEDEEANDDAEFEGEEIYEYDDEYDEEYDDDEYEEDNKKKNRKKNKDKKSTEELKLKKTSMSFFAALKLSFTNIKTKKGRTALTAFASSIGIIGIAIIIALSAGFQGEIKKFESDSFSSFPIMISSEAEELYMDTESDEGIISEYPKSKKVYSYDSENSSETHKNNITEDYIKYLEKINPSDLQSIGYTRLVDLNLLMKKKDKINVVNTSNIAFSAFPTSLNESSNNYLETNYDLLGGEYPKDKTELVLVLDKKNRLDSKALTAIGVEKNSVNFEDLIGLELKEILNDDYYTKNATTGLFKVNTDNTKMYNAKDSITLKIVGVIRPKKDAGLATLSAGIAYSDELSQYIIENAKKSTIVTTQKDKSYNVLTAETIDNDAKEMLIASLGGSSTPSGINIYPSSFESKNTITAYLDQYNESKASKDKILYTDMAKEMVSMTEGLMSGITAVLVAFAGISLVVSFIMISILTYTSVLERKKEIGILKALGASKKDITRVFDAETCILGFSSGLLGIAATYMLIVPINSVLYTMTEYKNLATLDPAAALMLIGLSTVLTILGGHVPAKIAAKKDAVEALRS